MNIFSWFLIIPTFEIAGGMSELCVFLLSVYVLYYSAAAYRQACDGAKLEITKVIDARNPVRDCSRF